MDFDQNRAGPRKGSVALEKLGDLQEDAPLSIAQRFWYHTCQEARRIDFGLFFRRVLLWRVLLSMNQTNTITPYTKRPMSNEDLAALLLSRGLVADRDKLLRVLAAVG